MYFALPLPTAKYPTIFLMFGPWQTCFKCIQKQSNQFHFFSRIHHFRANFESEDVEPREGGSAFAAYYKGKQVVNLWGGYADYESGQPWREDTMAIVASVTKGNWLHLNHEVKNYFEISFK